MRNEGRTAASLDANQIQLNLCIAVLARPKIQWRGIYFIYDRSGEAHPSKINPLEVTHAGIASFDSDMLKLR